MSENQTRKLMRIIESRQTTDGAGVKLRRSLGSSEALRLDPFLMLDEFGTENPDDYIAGFPPHPHRGFETVTYMIEGHMRHQDHLGNVGELKSGGVQWMTAGRGVIHSEMPQQESGRMRGFQLWINLPAAEKMKPAGYRDIPASEIPVVALPPGASVKIIAGRIVIDGQERAGPINPEPGTMATDPLFIDIILTEGDIQLPLPRGYNAFAYVYEGEVEVCGEPLPTQVAGILNDGDTINLSLRRGPARVIVLAGKPLGEPVVQHGPFVMNTREEIEQALSDYQQGRLTD